VTAAARMKTNCIRIEAHASRSEVGLVRRQSDFEIGEIAISGRAPRAQREPVDSERVTHIALQEWIWTTTLPTPMRIRTSSSAHRAPRGTRPAGANQTGIPSIIFRTHDLTFASARRARARRICRGLCRPGAAIGKSQGAFVLVRPAVGSGRALGFSSGRFDAEGRSVPAPCMTRCTNDGVRARGQADRTQRDRSGPLAFMRGVRSTILRDFGSRRRTRPTTDENVPDCIGLGSKAVVTGDHHASRSADLQAIRPADGHRYFARSARHRLTMFSSRDVVRHPLVQRIVKAYEASAPERRSLRQWRGGSNLM